MATSTGILLLSGSVLLTTYAYAGYPALLWLMQWSRPRRAPAPPAEWPRVSITVPVYNEEAQIRGMIESLLRIDYPADKRQILIVSDASSDGTDAIVREYADRGVELLRNPERRGKGAAENAAARHLTGDIVVNSDASIRIAPDALKPLIAQFADPEVGLASGRDISVAKHDEVNEGESVYVGYEMWIRQLETQISGIVGASGCFYAIRRDLHRLPLPENLSRDFAAAIMAREHGYRAVSVDEATCLVPRTGSLNDEYRRKVRTMVHGMQTLWFKRDLLNPWRHGVFAWMLFSHKVTRWLVPWTMPLALLGLILLAPHNSLAMALLWIAGAGVIAAAVGWALADRRPLPRLLAIPAFALASNVAAIHAGIRTAMGQGNALWEPTRREVIAAS